MDICSRRLKQSHIKCATPNSINIAGKIKMCVFDKTGEIKHLSHTSHTPLTHLSHNSHTPLTHLSHTSHTPPTHLSHTSLTPLTHLSHTSHTPPSHLPHTSLTPLSHPSHTPHTPLTPRHTDNSRSPAPDIAVPRQALCYLSRSNRGLKNRPFFLQHPLFLALVNPGNHKQQNTQPSKRILPWINIAFLRISELVFHYHLAPSGLVTMGSIIAKFTCVKISLWSVIIWAWFV